MDTLQHHWNVVALATLYKVQEERVSHLHQLCLPPRQVEVHKRAVKAVPSTLVTPGSQTFHHQRQFQQVYAVRWHEFLASDKCPDNPSVVGCGGQKVKEGVHK